LVISTSLEEADAPASDSALAKCMTRIASGVSVFLSGNVEDTMGLPSSRHLLTAAVSALYGAPAPELSVRGKAHVCWCVAKEGRATVSPQLLAVSELPLERHSVLSSCVAGGGFEYGQSRHIAKRLKNMRGLDEALANEVDLLRQLY
jgi:hypothetical protein